MALEIELPYKWRPRSYQVPAWKKLDAGIKRAMLFWHRRAGKDDFCLHRGAVGMHERVGTYWHMLPEAAQARKAIWDAINPHTGIRRIDEAFPRELRATTREQDMLIRMKNGSTWQVVGSDNYNSLVGSPPVGVTFSEWALAKPAAWAYLRPILAENGGWAAFITTSRGKNHAYRMMQGAKNDPNWFVQTLTADQTGVFTPEQLATERAELIREYGEDDGESLFNQEYYCSFDAALVGAYYGRFILNAEREGRIRAVPYEPLVPVHTVWDIGRSDDTAIWFYQVVGIEIRIIDCYVSHGKEIEHYAEVIGKKPYKYSENWLPHDAKPVRLGMQGKSILEQLWSLGVRCKIAYEMSIHDGIQAVRAMLPMCYFDAENCAEGIDALRSYRREWDDDKKCFKDMPVHDWASHPSDSFRYLACVWRREIEPVAKKEPDMRPPITIGEMIKLSERADSGKRKRI